MSEHNPHFEAYKIAIATRNFEIDLYWKRSLFFWGFIATAALGYGALLTATIPKPHLALVVACFGFICSLCWSLVNRGSKYWQEHWESMVTDLEHSAGVGELFTAEDKLQDKALWLNARKYSVSRTAIALSDFSIFVWGGVIANHILPYFHGYIELSKEAKIVAVIAVTAMFTFLVLTKCKSSKWESKTNEKDQTTYNVKIKTISHK